MRLSDNYRVQQLLKERSDHSSKLHAVETAADNSGHGFGISFNGTGEGGDAKKVAAAALVPFYQELIAVIDAELQTLGVEIDR